MPLGRACQGYPRRSKRGDHEYPNWGEPDCWSAPYTGDAYMKVLGIEPGRLVGRVDASGKPSLTTSDSVPASASFALMI